MSSSAPLRGPSTTRIAAALAVVVLVVAPVACARPGTPTIEVKPSIPALTHVTAAAPTIGPLPATGAVEANAVVKKVIDGDTVDVQLGGSGGPTERVRLIGIDTPESKKPDTPPECFSLDAAAGTAQLIPPGTPVRLVLDVEERDRYGRLLAYVLRASDGLFVNLELARAGYAGLLTYPPNVAHTDEFVAAVGAARAAGVGLWGRCEGEHEPA